MDLWGQALWDYHRGIRDKTFYLETSYGPREKVPLGEFFRHSGRFSPLEAYALSLCQGTVADIGAGAGAHALALQKWSIPVTAIERSKGACQVMKQRGVERVYCQDLYHHSKRYDTVLLLMNGLGLAGTKANLKHFLRILMEYLQPGGQIILDSCDISYLYGNRDQPVGEDELWYCYRYGEQTSQPFSWLFANQELLMEYSQQVGLLAQVIFEQDFCYLARLRVML